MKSKRIKSSILLVIAAAVILLTVILLQPELRAKRFVAAYGEEIEESLAAGHGISALINVNSFNTWEGEHSMTEFILFAWGDTYYGCYYSPDDVPLPFQNTGVNLTQDGHDYWEWQADGDNHGSTSKIRKCWYYFTASF